MTPHEALTEVIGMGEDMARIFSLARGLHFRTIKINGESLVVTRDYNPLRINVEIENGQVVKSHLG
jgi:hypothetical protein